MKKRNLHIHLHWRLWHKCTGLRDKRKIRFIMRVKILSVCINSISRGPHVSYTYQHFLVSLTLSVSTDPSLLDYGDHITQIKGKHLRGSNNPIAQNTHHSTGSRKLKTLHKRIIVFSGFDGWKWYQSTHHHHMIIIKVSARKQISISPPMPILLTKPLCTTSSILSYPQTFHLKYLLFKMFSLSIT